MRMISIHHQAGGNQFSKLMSSMAAGAGRKRKYVTAHVDDFSLSQSSTHTVEEAPKELLTPKTKSRVRHFVHFQEEHNVYYESPTYPVPKNHKNKNGQELPILWADRWYTSDEYNQMKASHKKEYRKLHRIVVDSVAGNESDDNHIDAILTAYQACDQGYMSKSLWLTIGLAAESDKTTQQHALERTGMEQVVVNAGIARGLKQRRRQRLLEQVVYLYVPEHFPCLSQQQLAEVIRERCTEITEPARLFAMTIGHANAL